MGRRLCSRRGTVTALALFLLLLLLPAVVLAARGVGGSRRGAVAGTWRRPGMGSGAGRLFGGYELPRAKLIPPSGPSERHNSVGPELTVSKQHQQQQQQQQQQVKKP